MTSLIDTEAIKSTDRILITGASGWLGRELLAVLHRNRPEVETLAVASEPKTFLAGEQTIAAVAWSEEAIASWAPTIVVHLAFQTREKVQALGEAQYVAANSLLSRAAQALYAIPSVRSSVIASSGAALTQPDHPYGQQKYQDEQRFVGLGAECGIATVIARAWSLSGALCPKPQQFAIYDIIRQAEQAPDIKISAQREVWRKYCDAGEYLMVCLTAAASGASLTVDSTGPLVELEELADAVQSALGTAKPLRRAKMTQAPDRYFSTAGDFARLANEFGIHVADLRTQILRSWKAVQESPDRRFT